MNNNSKELWKNGWMDGDCVLEAMDRCVEKLVICPGGELWGVVVDTFAPSPALLSALPNCSQDPHNLLQFDAHPPHSAAPSHVFSSHAVNVVNHPHCSRLLPDLPRPQRWEMM